MEVFVGSVCKLAQHLHHLVSKRARGYNATLGAFQLRGRDHLHGLGYLLRVLDRLESPADVEKIRHTRWLTSGTSDQCLRRGHQFGLSIDRGSGFSAGSSTFFAPGFFKVLQYLFEISLNLIREGFLFADGLEQTGM